MTKSETRAKASPRHAGDRGCKRVGRPRDDGVEPGHGLLSVLTFLRCETDRSATLLGDLAKNLSQALCTLATAGEPATRQAAMSDAAIALQQEDRVQQRLRDLAATLAILESVLDNTSPDQDADLDQAIIAGLRLEETRHAFAATAGIAETFTLPTPDKTPSIGDIDLF